MVTIGFGVFSPASRIRIPSPPQNSTTFISTSPELVGRTSDRDGLPAQRAVEAIVALKILNSLQTHVVGKHLAREPDALHLIVQFFDSAPDRPLGAEAQLRGDFVAVHTVAPRVWTTAVGVLHGAAGDYLLDDVGNVTDLVILLRASDIERLVVDQLAFGGEGKQDRARDVFNVHERPPGSAVALNEDLAGGIRDADEVVDDDIRAQTRRRAVGGRIPEERRAETIVGELRHLLLDQHLAHTTTHTPLHPP